MHTKSKRSSFSSKLCTTIKDSSNADKNEKNCCTLKSIKNTFQVRKLINVSKQCAICKYKWDAFRYYEMNVDFMKFLSKCFLFIFG